MRSISFSPVVEQRFFLQNRAFYWLTIAVMVTTIFSWFNLNSVLIMLLLACRLLSGKPLRNGRTAFTDWRFLAWFSIFFLDLAGLIYSHHPDHGWKYVESKATLVAIPFVICAGPFASAEIRRRFLMTWCNILFGICCFCLAMAAQRYMHSRDPEEFFYHTLGSPFVINAVFFSAYVISALLFLMSRPVRTRWGNFLGLFFIVMIVLLSSKLVLIFIFIILAAWLLRNKAIIAAVAIVAVAAILSLTNNPVRGRYEDMTKGNIKLYKRASQPPFTVYNGISLRLLIWRSAVEILNEHHAWVQGVTAGDSQELLNEKYLKNINGEFINYNFHNQYIETLVRSGMIGLIVFCLACVSLIRIAWLAGTQEAWFTVILVLLLYGTESMLEMQHSAFYCCFFPLLLIPDRSRRSA